MNKNGKEPFISVIVPAYNASRSIGRCLDSLINQEYARYEIIVVDDGSTDGTAEVVQSISSSRICYLRQDNRGAMQARLFGLEHCSGEAIVWVDADDWVESDYLRKLAQPLMHGADMSIIGFCVETNRGAFKVKHALSGNVSSTDHRQSESPFFPHRIGEFGIYPALWNKLIRKTVLEKLILTGIEQLKMGDDAAITYPAFYVSKQAVINNDSYPYHFDKTSDSSLSQRVDPAYFSRARLLINHLLLSCPKDDDVVDQIATYCTYLVFLGLAPFFQKKRILWSNGLKKSIEALRDWPQFYDLLTRSRNHLNERQYRFLLSTRNSSLLSVKMRGLLLKIRKEFVN